MAQDLLSGRVEPVDIQDEIQRSYLDYAMSVIVGRALPDVRDGLKPVQRRILWSMLESGYRPGRPHRKCAAAVGEVLKKYHPHGDTSVYDALVRIAQNWSLRAPLVDGHGNFGSPEGDPAAAYRYTEARLSPIAMELLCEIDQETVDFVANFDGYEQEPVLLPSRFPNLLVNGAGGIAVGMATNIPPHNLGEVTDAVVAMIDDPEISNDAPNRLAIRNETSKQGMRLVIDLRQGVNPHVALNHLYKLSQLQHSFGVIMLALVDGVPKVMPLDEVIRHYIVHQINVVTRRTQYQLRRAEERDHIVQGLLIALDHIDEVIRIIRGARDSEDARAKLMKRFELSEIQANHILDMPLRRLTRLARSELEQEHKELLERIGYLKGLLADPSKVRGVIKEELLEIRKKYANARRTQIKADEGDFDVEDLIAEEDVVITVSRAGYVKRQAIDSYRRQGRGGRGVIGTNL